MCAESKLSHHSIMGRAMTTAFLLWWPSVCFEGGIMSKHENKSKAPRENICEDKQKCVFSSFYSFLRRRTLFKSAPGSLIFIIISISPVRSPTAENNTNDAEWTLLFEPFQRRIPMLVVISAIKSLPDAKPMSPDATTTKKKLDKGYEDDPFLLPIEIWYIRCSDYCLLWAEMSLPTNVLFGGNHKKGELFVVLRSGIRNRAISCRLKSFEFVKIFSREVHCHRVVL